MRHWVSHADHMTSPMYCANSFDVLMLLHNYTVLLVTAIQSFGNIILFLTTDHTHTHTDHTPTSRRSQHLTVVSRLPVHNLSPSGEMSIQLAPSLCPCNCWTSCWLCRSHTAMLPSLQQLKHFCKRCGAIRVSVCQTQRNPYTQQCESRCLWTQTHTANILYM